MALDSPWIIPPKYSLPFVYNSGAQVITVGSRFYFPAFDVIPGKKLRLAAFSSYSNTGVFAVPTRYGLDGVPGYGFMETGFVMQGRLGSYSEIPFFMILQGNSHVIPWTDPSISHTGMVRISGWYY